MSPVTFRHKITTSDCGSGRPAGRPRQPNRQDEQHRVIVNFVAGFRSGSSDVLQLATTGPPERAEGSERRGTTNGALDP